VGSVPHDEVADYLAACDVLVAPYATAEDAWFSPLKIMEYRAVGRPVIASAISEVRDTLGEDQGVVQFPPGDENSLAQILEGLARSPRRRQRLAQAAAASSRWTWRELVREILEQGERTRRIGWRWI
jgi:glycosyltransferase involved in cell wall biosynthesis